jgi:hypothetical protein
VRIGRPPVQESDALRRFPTHGTRYRVKQRGWSHNIYRKRLDDYRNDEAACLEVHCGFGTRDPVCFVIPIRYLEEHVLPRAHLDQRNRYTFQVNVTDLSFTWQYGISMEGKTFLDQGHSSSRLTDDELPGYV